MPNRKHGTYDDMPPWFQPVALEIRAFIREGREDRKRATEDRKQATEDRRQAAIDRRMTLAVVRGLFRGQRELLGGQKEQTGILKDLLRATRGRGNGQRNNGR